MFKKYAQNGKFNIDSIIFKETMEIKSRVPFSRKNLNRIGVGKIFSFRVFFFLVFFLGKERFPTGLKWLNLMQWKVLPAQ